MPWSFNSGKAAAGQGSRCNGRSGRRGRRIRVGRRRHDDGRWRWSRNRGRRAPSLSYEEGLRWARARAPTRGRRRGRRDAFGCKLRRERATGLSSTRTARAIRTSRHGGQQPNDGNPGHHGDDGSPGFRHRLHGGRQAGVARAVLFRLAGALEGVVDQAHTSMCPSNSRMAVPTMR